MTPAERELKALAEKATPGPWCWEAHGQKSNDWTVGYALDENDKPLTGEIREPDFIVEAVGNSESCVLRKTVVIEQENSRGYSDAAYIAACSPERILALLARCEKLEAALREVTAGMPRDSEGHPSDGYWLGHCAAMIADAALADAEVTK